MKIVLTFFAVLMTFCEVWGANPEKHEVIGNDTTKFNTLMLGIDYTSNNSSFGRFSSSVTQPSYSSFASLYLKNNLNLGVNAQAIDNTDSTALNFTSQYNLSAGYDLNLGKLFSASLSYTHYIYSKNSYSLNSIYTDEFLATLDFEWKKLYANTGIFYMLGDKNEWMNNINVGLNFNIFNVFFKGHSISISPEIGAIVSNQDYYNQYAFKTYWYLVPVANARPELTVQRLYNNPEQFPRLWNFLNTHPRKLKQFSLLDKNTVISDLFKAESARNISSVSFTLPIYYNLGYFSVNFIYSATIPLNVPEYFDNSTTQFFSAGLVYSFAL